ncbi:MAG: hypothetical protein HY399_03150 [Elusimicrobia bacterium]|nr:hypothetical protein [Elusimicrobiota bacterium]
MNRIEKKLKRLLYLLLISVASFPKSLSTETLTLTTYYPAPYGVYNEMRTTGNAYLAYQSGNVGIGTSSPINKLSVLGNADFAGALIAGGVVKVGALGSEPSGEEGAIYLNTSDPTNHQFKGYANGAWAALGAGGGGGSCYVSYLQTGTHCSLGFSNEGSVGWWSACGVSEPNLVTSPGLTCSDIGPYSTYASGQAYLCCK